MYFNKDFIIKTVNFEQDWVELLINFDIWINIALYNMIKKINKIMSPLSLQNQSSIHFSFDVPVVTQFWERIHFIEIYKEI